MNRDQLWKLEELEDDLYDLLNEVEDKSDTSIDKLWQAWSIMRVVFEDEYHRLED